MERETPRKITDDEILELRKAMSERPMAGMAAPSGTAPVEVRCSEWVDAFTTALGYWKMNADKNSASNRTLDERCDYEAQVYRRCKAVLAKASTNRI